MSTISRSRLVRDYLFKLQRSCNFSEIGTQNVERSKYIIQEHYDGRKNQVLNLKPGIVLWNIFLKYLDL